MKATAVKTNSFPGDTFLRIDVHLADGRIIAPFGVWPKRDKVGRWYECDGGGYFDTLKQAKSAAIRKVLSEED